MQIITIPELDVLVHSKQLTLSTNTDQNNFQLVMKQIFLGLPVQPLLAAHPQINAWVNQVRSLAPKIFKLKQDQLLIDTQFSAALPLDNDTKVIQICTNVVFEKNKSVRLIEWAIRRPNLIWYDRVKLWVASDYLMIPPQNLRLTILALHPTISAKKRSYCWSQKQHEKTRCWLTSVLAQVNSIPEASTIIAAQKPFSQPLTLPVEEVEEVQI